MRALGAGPDCDVLRLTRQNAAVADIARTWHLAESTVRHHLSAAMTKTDTASRHAAAAWENGWLWEVVVLTVVEPCGKVRTCDRIP